MSQPNKPTVVTSTQHHLTLKSGAANGLTAEHFQMDDKGRLVISNPDLASLIQQNLGNALKTKANDEPVSVGISVGS